MAYFRRFEIVCDTLYKQRAIRGFCHLYDGQEAVLVGMEAALAPGDSMITSYREHCHQITRGDTGDRVMAELMGKRDGCSGGKGGSMHLYYPQNNFYGGNGIVGAQVPIGAGLAFAHKYRKDGGLAVAAYGDGAANQGQIFEAANMAALWGLPMIFLIENNEYGMGTSSARGSASNKFYTRGDYIPGIWIDGMDVLATKKGFQWAAEYVRVGRPLFVEVSTYRYHGHSMSDPGISYRSREEVKAVQEQRDCIDQTKQRLLEAGWATPAEIKAMTKEARALVDANVKFAQASHVPELAEIDTNIYQEAYSPRRVRHGLPEV
jgi:pyruvate dehydrogenase E1 component alpha subunit